MNLETQADFYPFLLNLFNDAVVVADASFGVRFLNKRAQRLYGVGEERPRSLSALAVFENGIIPPVLDRICGRIRHGQSWRGELDCRLAHGRDVRMKITVARMGQAPIGVGGFLFVMREIPEAAGGEHGEDKNRVEGSESEWIQQQRQLRKLASDLTMAEERQRKHIAYLLHDGPCQDLAMAITHMKMARDKQSDPAAAAVINEVVGMVETTMNDLRSLSFDLCPPALYELSFPQAVRWLFERHLKRSEIDFHLEFSPQDIVLDDDNKTFVFQAVSELLVNVVKHASASRVNGSAVMDGGRLIVSIVDDGCGMDLQKGPKPQRASEGLGLFSLRERLGHFGGSMTVESEPGKGTRVVLTVPVD